MKPFINFSFLLHNHQPVGNPDEVIENCFNCAYYPFLEVLDRHPKIKVAFHFSGILLDWLDSKYPDYLDRVKKGVKRGQIELLAGAYYEPILPLIPQNDAVDSIKMHIQRLNKRFDAQPTGLWLAERVWDPSIIPTLNKAGIKWVVVDEIHLIKAGLDQEKMGPVKAESMGESIILLPIDKKLRYMLPYENMDSILEFFDQNTDYIQDRLFLCADDGEKFGDWPGTFQKLYQEKWLSELFQYMERESDRINMLLPGEYLEKNPPTRILQVPPCSYEEMTFWSLPTKRAIELEYIREISPEARDKNFLIEGYFPNFLNKYPESNFIHKRVLDLSKRYALLAEKKEKEDGDKKDHQFWEKLKDGRENLLKAQCNCAYWHGVFGGIYLPHLRGALYYHLNKANWALEELEKTDFSYRKLDFDGDGIQEIQLSTRKNRLSFKERGGALISLDHKTSSLNVCDVLARRAEHYHPAMYDALSRDQDFTADWHPRYNLLDHFFPENISLGQIKRATCPEQGDFVDGLYKSHIRGDDDRHILIFEREGRVKTKNGFIPFNINKIISTKIDDQAINVEYQLLNLGQNTENVNFGIEFNLALPAVDQERCFMEAVYSDKKVKKINLSDEGILENLQKAHLYHGTANIKIIIEMDMPASIYYFPIRTCSAYHNKMEKIHQGFCFMPIWNMDAPSNRKTGINIKLDILEKNRD